MQTKQVKGSIRFFVVGNAQIYTKEKNGRKMDESDDWIVCIQYAVHMTKRGLV